MTGRDIFISYSSKDEAIARLACERLEQTGYTCWFAPRDIPAGEFFAGQIIQALRESRFVLLFFSEHSNASAQVLREINFAVSQRLPMLVVRLDSTLLNNDFEYLIRINQWLDVSHLPNDQDRVAEISSGIEAAFAKFKAGPNAGASKTPIALVFGDFEILADSSGKPIVLGKGGMGETYRARQVSMDRVVALKVIQPEFLDDENIRRRFLREAEDPHNPGLLDTHPLVREYFGGQLRSQRSDAWTECNKRLYHHYRTLAPQLPNSFREMEPLFLAVICGCNAGLFREALHEVYIPRIQRADLSFAAKVLGTRGALLLVLAHFFECGRWDSPVETGVEEHSLTKEDQLFILTQTGSYLMATRGYTALEARICYQRAESLSDSLNRPLLLYAALMGEWRHSNVMGKLSEALEIAKRLYSLAQEHDESLILIGACHALACTLYYLGEFESSRQYAMRAIQIWRSGSVQSPVEEVDLPITSTLCWAAMSDWHLGDIASSKANMAEAISLAKELNDMHGLAVDLLFAAILGYYERNPAEVERCASDLIELSTRHHFAHYMAVGAVYRGWALSASGNVPEGIAWIEDGIRDYRAVGAIVGLASHLRVKAEALYVADRTCEALETIREADAISERTGEGPGRAELLRLRGMFLAATGAGETQIEASFCEAIRIAKEQKSVPLKKRAEETYEEYRRQKASGSEGRGCRLPLW
jgi:tetratricopeptide (TPR) repeat protein